ncbi:hypothetical protein EDD85DRAFT_430415 [Armillaria nabsnona]|nr:hypothetical protein EDD85DRAFT_430415 [Armillaria nabsnona]
MTSGMLFFASRLGIPSWGVALSNMILPLERHSSRCLFPATVLMDIQTQVSSNPLSFYLWLGGEVCESRQRALRRAGGTRIACLSTCLVIHVNHHQKQRVPRSSYYDVIRTAPHMDVT